MRKYILSLVILFLSCNITQAEIIGEEKTYFSKHQVFKGYLAYDDRSKEKRPGIIVVHEWWGHNDYARKRARQLAELGYIALAIDMYGGGRNTEHPDEAGAFAKKTMEDKDRSARWFRAGLETLKKHPLTDKKNIGAIGYCFGGSTVLNMARRGMNLKGVVSFHGSLATDQPARLGRVKAKVLVCHGAADSMIPPEHVEAFKAEMETAGVDYTFKSYPKAKHSFTNPAANKLAKEFDLPIGYNRKADRQSWKDMQNFFKEVFKE